MGATLSQQDSVGASDVNAATGVVGAVTGVANTASNIYEDYQAMKLNKDKWGMEKQKMQQDYIAQQRKAQWQQQFQNHMLGIPGTVGLV